MYDLDLNVIGFFFRGPLVKLPVVDVNCMYCGCVATINGNGVSASRVGGDSRYGYETYHNVCQDEELAALEAEEAQRQADSEERYYEQNEEARWKRLGY